MAAKKDEKSQPVEGADDEVLRQPSEILYRNEIEALKQNDSDPAPKHWHMSPRAVLAFVLGGKTLKAKIDGKTLDVPISKKFYGDDTIVERAIVTLASERALLLVGEPGTGKSWLSEHLAAAISGTSNLTVQGTAGTTEEHIKYSWNIARVIAEGPNPTNLIPSPTMVAMKTGRLLRFEEITRCLPDVQDSLVSILSDKGIAIPELPDANMVWAKPGFNVIATANTRDQGVNELSAALKRRFNYIHIPVITDHKTEVEIVQKRAGELLQRYDMPVTLPPPIIELLTTVFREIREGKTDDGVSVKKPSTTVSTAEAISVAIDAALYARFFGGGEVGARDIARNLVGSIVKEDINDLAVLKEYVVLVAKRRGEKDKNWREFHDTVLASIK
ncbi:MAG: AAA family ATPase [Candidatus Melainabacteria bacterium]|nr:AAA family ATPase [Candidatus Melainabacteria bacterium]